VDEASLRPCVAADRQRLKQVLLNLLSNAIKFNSYGGTVRIRGAQVDDARVAIAVTDTGIGIAPADMPRLFHPFERLRSGAEDVEGSGLGLALTRGLLDAMDGSIDAVSTPGEGSTFTLELPGAAAVPAQPRKRALSGSRASLDRPDARDDQTRTVLYIEDNTQNVELMEQVFAALDDLDLITAPDGEAGLELARASAPDLVLLDLHLPGIDGDEVLDRLRADAATNAIPVIVVSADATPAQIDALLARGALDYVTKPVDIARLVALIDDALIGLRAN
jgi:CheY-like chemotaxis protein/anti-sigma regulatory factor (Ser/Thr protein kinase)